MVEKGCLPSEKLNSILFLLGFDCFKEQISVCVVSLCILPGCARAVRWRPLQIKFCTEIIMSWKVLILQLPWGIPDPSAAGGKGRALL